MDSKPIVSNNPIGLFDSGVGGFSVLKEIIKKLPYENTVYFADTGRRRYGTKSEHEVLGYAFEIIQFLITKKTKAVVIACNTATAVALEKAKNKFNLPILGVIESGVREAIKYSKNRRIGLIGSEITIRSKTHKKLIAKLCPTIKVFALATPLLGEFVEKNLSEKEEIQNAIKNYLCYFEDKNIDTLILGCTHYPFLESFIRKYLGDKIYLVDPAKAVVTDLKEILGMHNLLNRRGNIPNHTFFTSGDLDKLDTNIKQLLKLGDFIVKTHKF